MKIAGIILFIILTTLIILTYRFIKTILDHRNSMKRLDEWSKFNQKVLEWSNEIKDYDIKVDYLEFCTDNIILLSKSSVYEFNIVDTRNEIIRKYINHIPSLKQELREEKLNKILK